MKFKSLLKKCETLLSIIITISLIKKENESGIFKLNLKPNSKKIGVGVIVRFMNRGGGVERVAGKLCEELSKTGLYNVYLLTGPIQPDEYEINYKVIERRVIFRNNKSMIYPDVERSLYGINILINNIMNVKDNLYLSKFKKPIIYFFHGPYFYMYVYNPKFDFLGYLQCVKDTGVLVNLNPDENHIYNEKGITKIMSIPNLITFDFDKIVPSKLNSKIIIMNASGERKNPKIMLYAMKFIIREIPEAKLLLYGVNKNDKNEIIKLAESLKILENIEIQGRVKTKNIYENATIYIMASYMEAYPLAVNEAKSFGIPVVVSGCEELWNTKFGTIRVKMDDATSGYI